MPNYGELFDLTFLIYAIHPPICQIYCILYFYIIKLNLILYTIYKFKITKYIIIKTNCEPLVFNFSIINYSILLIQI
jgi:hypothetical protein